MRAVGWVLLGMLSAGLHTSLAAERQDIKAAATATTQLYVRTIPSGAKVLVDGLPPAESDCLLELEGAKKVTVHVEMEGFQGEVRKLTLETGKIARIEIHLTRLPEPAEADALAPLPRETIEQPDSRSPWQTLGLELQPASLGEEYRTRYSGGLLVRAVRPDSPADREGIRKGDILVGLHKWETASLSNLDYILSRPELESLGPLKFVVLRGDEAFYGNLSIQVPPGESVAAESAGKAIRHFVRVVVGPDRMTFEGQSTTWESLPELLKGVLDRQHTVLEVAIASDDMTVKQRDEAIAKVTALAQQFAFEYASFIGVHPLGSKGSKPAAPAYGTHGEQAAVEKTVHEFLAAVKRKEDIRKFMAPGAKLNVKLEILPPAVFDKTIVRGGAAVAFTTPIKLDLPEVPGPFRAGYALVRSQDQWRIKTVLLVGEGQMPTEAQLQEFLESLISEGNMGEPASVRSESDHESLRALAKEILQRDDAARRTEALEKVRELLAGESAAQGLRALAAALPAKFDREPFRPLVIPLLKAEDAVTREMAVRVLPGLEPTGEDLTQVLAMVDDPSARVRGSVGGAIIQMAQGKQAEKVIPALMKLLKDSDPKVIEDTLRSMWGQYSSPEFDERLIELSHEPKHHGSAIYFALSTMKSKSPAVARRLVEELADPDWNNSGRAAWGLTYGVTEEAKPIVEEGLLRALAEETNGYTRSQEFRALRGVATEKSRAYLESVVESEQETDEFKKQAAEILEGLDVKSGR